MKLGYSRATTLILSHPTVAYRVHDGQTMRQVHRFVETMRIIISKEKSGAYPGRKRHIYKRYAFIGGPIFYWIKAVFRAR